MKIGIIVTVSYNSGGIYQYTKSILEALHESYTQRCVVYLKQGSQIDLSFITRSNWSIETLDSKILTENYEALDNRASNGLDVVKAGFNSSAYDFFKTNGIDLLIYPAPWEFSFECGIPYIIAIHDLQHRLQPEFPEVSANGTWECREYLFRNAVRYADGVLVDSDVGKEDVLTFYGDLIKPDKIYPLPFVPSFISCQTTQAQCDEVRRKYQLSTQYLFYPAQFWRHKNHERLIRAIHLLRSRKGIDIPLVLSGSYIGPRHEAREQVFYDAMALAQRIKVDDLIRYIGYVPDEDMVPLYSMAAALVMPTFFGPTNIPILEAWACNCPVLTSDIRGVREQVGDAGVLVDPHDPEAIAEGIYSILFDDEKTSRNVAQGRKRLEAFTQSDFSRRLIGIIENLCGRQNGIQMLEKRNQPPLLSAVVSTYNSERFMRGCLEDLTGQSLFAKGRMEIVIIDSGSSQNEATVVKEFQQKFAHIKYFRTERETLYGAWNRGIREASGKYITNANTDDRHRQDALEVLLHVLEENPGIDLVYGDCYVSAIPNETFADNNKTRLYRYPDYSPPSCLLYYHFGPQPMWRRSIHDRIGFFDDTFKAAGDYDFNIRFALAGLHALHVNVPLGLYLEHENAISFKDNAMALENRRLADTYRVEEHIVELYRNAGVSTDSIEALASVFVDLGNSSCEYYPPWKEGGVERNLELAINCFSIACKIVPAWDTPWINLAIACYLAGYRDQAITILISRSSETASHIHAKLDAVTSGSPDALELMPSGLPFSIQKCLSIADSSSIARTCDGQGPHQQHVNQPLTVTLVASVGEIDPVECCGGLETAMRGTARALALRGHRVALVGNLKGNSGRYDGIEYIAFDAWKAGNHTAYSRDTDILAFASGPDLESYLYAGKQTVRIAVFHHQELKFLLSANPCKILNDTVDAVICVSQAVRGNLIRDGIEANRLFVVPNGYDPSVFYQRTVARSSQRIIFAGALVPDKNPLMIIEAFIKLLPLFPDAELHICGAASLWGAQEYIDRDAVTKLSSNIFFHGVLSQEELARQYSQAAICVIPSKYESFSLVSLEAQACGCVPLVANVGGVPETLIPGITGFIYEPNDVDTLEKALLLLLKDTQKLKAASKNARSFVANTFSWDKTAEKYEKIFYDLLDKNICSDTDAPEQQRKEHEPIVSVVIPCYNYARYLSEAVTSVLRQTLQDFEIIIVNDGSIDNSLEIAEKLIADNPDHSIRLINQKNSGQPAISRNNGIRVSRGRYIICLDADDMITPTMLQECLHVLESNPEIAIAYTNRLDFDGVEGVVQAGEYDFSRLIHANHISYCALYRREVWERVGGYRENVKGVEDWDFWIAAGALGFYGKRIPLPLFKYRRHDTGLFQEALKDFGRKQAQIIINNAAVYDSAMIAEAEKALSTAPLKSPLVSVIVPTYNRPEMLAEALRSVLAQTFPDFEIIVVNDAGVDVKPLIDHFNSSGNIRYINKETNQGLAAARNTGIGVARGKYIAYLDDDDIYYPDHLETLVGVLEERACKVAYTDARRAFQEKRGERYCTIKYDDPYGDDYDADRLLVENFIPVLCVMHHKECLETAGMFDETLYRHEDWDLWIRISRHFTFIHIPRTTAEYTFRETDSSGMTSGSLPAMIATLEDIYRRTENLTAGNPSIQAKRKGHQFDLRNNVYKFLQKRNASYGGKEKEEDVMQRLLATGAPDNIIRSAMHLTRGTARAESDPVEALADFSKALDADPLNCEARRCTAETLVRLGRVDDAISQCEAILAQVPDEPEFIDIMAAMTRLQGNPEKAGMWEERARNIRGKMPAT
jgi:glycosyltransferase involved in cell wall biosynthesis